MIHSTEINLVYDVPMFTHTPTHGRSHLCKASWEKDPRGGQNENRERNLLLLPVLSVALLPSSFIRANNSYLEKKNSNVDVAQIFFLKNATKILLLPT